MRSQWQPFHEPLRSTLLRNGTIALVAATLLATAWGFARWPMACLLMLWPTFGGHGIEIFFLNWLRPRLSPARAVQVVARLAIWYLGGILLALGVALTAAAFPFRLAHPPAWWLGGLAFIGIELIAHLAMQLRGLGTFYNGRG